jgi:hypothetical protein
VKLLPPRLWQEHRAAAAVAAERPVSRRGMLLVLLTWATLGTAAGLALA